LLGTEVYDIAGQPALVCSYRGFAAAIPVMRRIPPGYSSCAAVTGGFDCSSDARAQRAPAANATPVTQARSNAQIATQSSNDAKPATTRAVVQAPTASKEVAPATTQTRAQAPVARGQAAQKEVIRALPGNRVSNANVPLQLCADPAVTRILVRGISRQSANVYNFVLTGYIGNEGTADYRSGAEQQQVQVYRTPQGAARRLVKSERFGNLRVRDSVDILQREFSWNTTTEFPPSFEFVIVYDPDIVKDGNTANDDCRPTNNRLTITGAEINAQIRASGR
jgi:hypothetical protein